MSAPEKSADLTTGRALRAKTPRTYPTEALKQHGHSKKVAKSRSQNQRAAVGGFKKASVTIPTAVLEEARSRAGAGGFSAYVTAAVEQRLASDRLRDLIAELDAEYGPVPEEKVAEAAAAWPSQ